MDGEECDEWYAAIWVWWLLLLLEDSRLWKRRSLKVGTRRKKKGEHMRRASQGKERH